MRFARRVRNIFKYKLEQQFWYGFTIFSLTNFYYLHRIRNLENYNRRLKILL
jgi:hypothetical protein